MASWLRDMATVANSNSADRDQGFSLRGSFWAVKLSLAEQDRAKFVVGAQAGHGSQHWNSDSDCLGKQFI